MEQKETIEQEARRLRDLIYGKQATQKNWDHCKDNWIKEIEWLRAQAKKLTNKK